MCKNQYEQWRNQELKKTSEYYKNQFEEWKNQGLKSKENHPSSHNPLSEIKWETIAHELAYVLDLLEDDPNDLKTWRKVWNALKVYEGVAKR
jgi:hypothetical protein